MKKNLIDSIVIIFEFHYNQLIFCSMLSYEPYLYGCHVHLAPALMAPGFFFLTLKGNIYVKI
jgi:hypothetical protein